MAYIRTILGDKKISDGYIYSHEHLITNPPEIQRDRDLELSDYYKSLIELKSFKKVGGKLLVEATTLDYGRNTKLMKMMAEESGVDIVFCTGFNKALYFPEWVYSLSIEELTEKLMRDIVEGADDTECKAGFIKTGSSYNIIHEIERKTVQAIVSVSNQTNTPIWLHTEAGTMGVEMLDLVEGYNGDITKTVIGHSDRNPDYFYYKKILERGAYIQFDGVSKVKYHPDSIRIDLIKKIIDSGYEDQLLISGDMGRQSYLHSYQGGPGFEFIITKFIPRMIEEGIPMNIVKKIFIDNPIRWLAHF